MNIRNSKFVQLKIIKFLIRVRRWSLKKIRIKYKIRYVTKNKKNYGVNKEQRTERIIVSLTTIPSRLEKLHLVIKSMLLQSLKPDLIILNIGEDINSIPSSLLDLKKYGLIIKNRDGDIKPHKKYYYVMQEYPNDLIITIDDDLIYSLDLIEELYNTHQKFPNCVVAARAHKILFDDCDNITKYIDWDREYAIPYKPSMQLLSTGCGGVLYPPCCMDGDLLNIDLIKKLSLNADDLWLKIMEVRKEAKVVLCDQNFRNNNVSIPNSQQCSLKGRNVKEGLNDIYFQNLLKYYNLRAKDFRD